jgi:HKD family nuclease
VRSGKIKCRIYRKDKFHVKAYIAHARLEVVGSYALVGLSNMTYPGLTENIELNVQITGAPVSVLLETSPVFKKKYDISLFHFSAAPYHDRVIAQPLLASG